MLEAVITAPPTIKRTTSFPGVNKGADTETKGYTIRQGPREDKRRILEHFLTPYTKVNPKWIKTRNHKIPQ